jgi:hypothetical protein
MDPDKKKGQTYLDGKCPTCGGDSEKKKIHKANANKSKRQLKRERQAKAKAERAEMKRAAKNR